MALPAYRQRVIQQVHDVPDEHLPALLRVVEAFRESVTLPSAEESVRRGWAEVERDEVRPVSELWEEGGAE